MVSGVGRASIYRHFASNDELVAEVLRGYDERWRERLRGTGETFKPAPRQPLDSVLHVDHWQDR